MDKLPGEREAAIYKPLDEQPAYKIKEKDRREIAEILVAGLCFGKYYTDEIG